MGRPTGGERGVSELYGTLLVIGLTVVVGIFLIGTGTFVVQQLTTDSEQEISREVMYDINDQIDSLVQGSSGVYEASNIALPREGTDALSVSDEGTLTITVSTHAEYADRTAKQNGTQSYSLGSIRHESTDGIVTVYQGGGLWEQSSNGEAIRLRSQPYLDFTGNRLDFQVVDVSDLDILQPGETLNFERNPSAENNSRFEELLGNLTDDIYNANIRAPVNVTITIESQYAEAWQAYAEEEMSEPLDSSDTSLNDENNTLTLEFGTIGEFVSRTQSPTFGDDQIIYSGTSDYAYKYYNRTVGTVDGNHSAFGVTDPTNDADHQLALYNASGRWLLYNSTSGQWTDSTGTPVDPNATAAIERVDGGGNDTYQIKPPAELSGPAASTPVCLVDGTRSETLRLLDESGEDCLETMVGVPEDAVDSVELAPRFDVTITNPGDVPDQLNITDAEDFDLDVEIKNIGEATGSTPLGVYAINQSNNVSGDLSEAYLLGGETNVTLDPGDDDDVELTVPAQTGMGGQNWTFFATSGQAGAGLDFVGKYTEVPDPAVTFNITDIEPDSGDLIVGQTTDIEITVEETEDSIGGSLDLDALLLVNGTASAVKDFEISGGETETVTVEWTPAQDGSVTLNASLVAGSANYDSSIANVNETTVSVTPAYSEFEVEITGTNSPVTEGEQLNITAEIENNGTVSDTQDVQLEAFGGGAVDLAEDVDLDPGETQTVVLRWETIVGDAGTGEIEVLSGDDNDTAPVNITEKTVTRDAVDVMFALDETGSMGSFVPWQDYWGPSLTPPAKKQVDSGTYTAPTDLNFTDLDLSETTNATGEEFWLYLDSSAEYATVKPNETIDESELFEYSGLPNGQSPIWAGERFNSTVTVPEEADMWYVLPENNGRIDTDTSQGLDALYGNAEGDFYVSGQTIDPEEYGGEAYIVELSSESCSSLCYDAEGQRYDAVQAGLAGLDADLGDRAGLMAWDTDQNVYQTVSNNLSKVEQALRIDPIGGTDITEALLESQEELNDLSDPQKKNIVLLTDGQHNAGDPQPNDDDILDQIDDDVTVYTIGFGSYDEDVLSDIADAGTGKGKLLEADNADELEDVFDSVISNITEPDTPTFEVEITDTNAPVVSTETVEVTANVTNTGAADGEGVVSLTDFDGTGADSTTVDLDQNESETVTLEWEPDDVVPDGADQITDNVTVITVDDEANESATVEAPPEVTIDNLDISDPVATESSVTVGAKLAVNSSTEATIVLSVVDPAGRETQVDQKTTNLLSGGKTVDLSWDVGQQSGPYEVIVETRDDRADSSVTVESAAFDVSIDDVSPDAVEAGDPMNVTVTVENKGTDDRDVFLWLEDEAGNELDLETDLTIDDGDTETVTLTWNTVFGDGDEDPQTVTAVVAEPGVTERTWSDTTAVTVEPITTEIDDATIFEPDVAIGIDLTAIETSTSDSD